jgi:transcription-repair coupling factor (superfamily II helicase)
MHQRVCRGQSAAWTKTQQTRDEVLAVLRNLFELLVIEVELSLFDFVHHFCLFALEWEVATNDKVKQHSHRPCVNLLVVARLKEQLRRHVIACASYLRPHLIPASYFRQAEVDQLDLVVFGNHDVLGLDVSVDHPVSMAVVDRRE